VTDVADTAVTINARQYSGEWDRVTEGSCCLTEIALAPGATNIRQHTLVATCTCNQHCAPKMEIPAAQKWANERHFCPQPECSAYIRPKLYLYSVYILCILSIFYLHAVYILPTWSVFYLFCDSISFHTVYFLSIFYVAYIEFLAILPTFCMYCVYLYILSICSLSSIHIPCVF
jgi:hypothetical protein